ncbi:MAG: transposase [Alphaproteobacteria bacterium]|nr:transposase [Alphaproteobacteria bacterium]
MSRDLRLWAYQKGVTLDFSRPDKPTDNSFIESFSENFPPERLNTHWLMSVDDTPSKWRNSATTTKKSVPIVRSVTDAGNTDEPLNGNIAALSSTTPENLHPGGPDNGSGSSETWYNDCHVTANTSTTC